MPGPGRIVIERNHKVAISAHCGGAKEEDGSLPILEAYENSLMTGAEYVEFDIRRTHDGELVVHHDARAERAGRAVSDLTYKELCHAKGHAVPRVRDVMEVIAGKAIGHLDLKEIGYEDEVISLALEVLGPGNFVATTLEDESIKRIKEAFPGVRTALSLGRATSEVPWLKLPLTRLSEWYPFFRLRRCGADWIAANSTLARIGVLWMARRKGIGVMVWTVNKEPSIRRLLRKGQATVLITDYPRRAAAIRDGSPALS